MEIIYFRNGPFGIGRIIVSVKSGDNIGPSMEASILGTLEREKAQLGVFICLSEPTRRMRQEAAGAGVVATAEGRFQRIQIATIQELMHKQRPDLPQIIETEALGDSLRPVRPTRFGRPSEQMSFMFEIGGGKKRDTREHWSGSVLARAAASE